MKIFFIKKNKGFMAVEILVAVSIIVLSVLASTAVAHKSLVVSRRAISKAQVNFLLEEGAELVRLYRDYRCPDYVEWETESCTKLNGLDSDYYLYFYEEEGEGRWEILNSPSTTDNFTRKVSFSQVYRDSNEDISFTETVNKDAGKLTTITVDTEEAGETISTSSLKFYISRLNIHQ